MDTGIRHYEKIAKSYMETAPDGSDYHGARFAAFNSLLPDGPSRIIDFGCGSGENVATMADMGHTVEGIDPVTELIDQARKNAPNCKFVVGDANFLKELPTDSVEVVTALSVLSYLDKDETDTFYRESKRILSPGGVMIASYSNALVDMLTFNRFTVQFWEREIIPFLSDDDATRKELLDGLKSRLAFPEEPTSKHSENDKVIRNRRNPLTLAEELEPFGFRIEATRFMHWHPLPPQYLENSPHKSLRFTNELPEWMGAFLSSLFCVRAS
jgi:ubiquinone/menaquinone biosynthesis C-methylase UbiE